MKVYELQDIRFIEIMRRGKPAKYISFDALQVRGEIRERADNMERFGQVRRVNCYTQSGSFI